MARDECKTVSQVSDVERGRVGALHLREGRVYYAELAAPIAATRERCAHALVGQGHVRAREHLDRESADRDQQPLENMLMEGRGKDELATSARSTRCRRTVSVSVVRPARRVGQARGQQLAPRQDILEAGGWWEVMMQHRRAYDDEAARRAETKGRRQFSLQKRPLPLPRRKAVADSPSIAPRLYSRDIRRYGRSADEPRLVEEIFER